MQMRSDLIDILRLALDVCRMQMRSDLIDILRLALAEGVLVNETTQ